MKHQNRNNQWRNMTTAVMPQSPGYGLAIPLKKPAIIAGMRVSKVIGTPGVIGDNLITGVATGVSTKSLPPEFEILWDDDVMSMELASSLMIQSRPGPHSPVREPFLPPEEVIVIPAPVEKAVCGDKQYSILDMCIDKNIAIVVGVFALYLIVKK